MNAAVKTGVTAVMTAMTDAERPWVGPAIASILRQTVLPDQVLVMVESANAWIEEEVERVAAAPEERRRVAIHRIPMARLGAVRNQGTALATTRWVAFLDGDDVWRPQKLERQLAVAAEHPDANFVACDFVFINERGDPFAFPNGTYPTPSAYLVDRVFMLEHPFDPVAKQGEDHTWLLGTQAVSRRVRLPETLVGYRIRGQSISALHGKSGQRVRREAMARWSRFGVVRFLMLGVTGVRYLLARGRGYTV